LRGERPSSTRRLIITRHAAGNFGGTQRENGLARLSRAIRQLF
jgi:hypothetical protein